jgi:hypothetical protein
MSDDLTDDLKESDTEEDKELDIENPELSEDPEEQEPDFTAPAPQVFEEDIEEDDPHSSFDTHTEVEDPHMDIYGDAGNPYVEEEEEDEYDDLESESY